MLFTRNFFYLLVSSLVLLYSCSNDDESYNNASNNVQNEEFISLDFETGNYKSNGEITTFDYSVELTNTETDESMIGEINIIYDTKNEELKSIDVSNSIFDFTGITESELQNEITKMAYGDDDDDEGFTKHAKCMEACYDKYIDEDGNKKEGLGRCKSNCWVDTSIRAIKALAPFAAALLV